MKNTLLSLYTLIFFGYLGALQDRKGCLRHLLMLSVIAMYILHCPDYYL